MVSVIRGDDDFDSGVVHDTLISSTTVTTSVASVNFTGFDASKYGSYLITVSNVIPSTNNANFRCRTSTNGGSTWDSGGSDYAYINGFFFSGGADRASSTGANFINLSYGGIDNASGKDGMSGTINILGPHLTKTTGIVGHFSGWGPWGIESITIGGKRNSAADVDGIQFLFDTGNIASGTFEFYGIAGV